MSENHRGSAGRDAGVAFGAGAYFLWGAFPAFFGLLTFASPVEVLASRILWTLVVSMLALLVAGRMRELWRAGGRTWRLAAVASLAISLNWGVYVYAIMSEQVVEAALGYFINPLVTVAFGVIIFREKLRRMQWVALGLGAVAVIVLTVDYGRPPWIALVLACTFATYGLVKKVIRLEALPGLAAEGIVAAPFAVAIMVVLAVTGNASFGSSWSHSALLMVTGPVTLVPLILFALAAPRVPLSTMGLLQYLTPALQMAWGVLVVHEAMPPSRWAGFALIWLALAVFTGDALRRSRRAPVAIPD
ncbi:EamA family transporter RarD [Nocardia sp. NPDC127526]|uniref:EamA family transporter RarD n=1 Tax=Nocardia sp. NPDC127526 TaxID=3345393 RepID=UPI00363E49C6